ncbi:MULTISPECIES: DUF4157 domain-containing protein [unclassified Streptomyces]|uniref:eCIS core domain-containing protein n=1 Tax=unclassified Streptomyces TaxID=2593676 RepID=UPI001CB72844|nr:MULTISPECIES: DUF4157 domain-containing protein [unclassified Streptomyces]
MTHEHHPTTGVDQRRDETPARAAFPRQDSLRIQRTAGNMAMVRMLQRAGYPYAQQQHGAGCGHRSAPEAESTPVQRSTVHDVLRAPGRPLDDGTRTDMEARLGADFSDVRVHDGPAAKNSAAEVGARAYTSGSHVVIGEGGGDRHTLAHELTHVIQQRQGPVAGSDNGDGLRVSDPSDRFEREAEANARVALSAPAPSSAPALQRTSADDAPGTTGSGTAARTGASAGAGASASAGAGAGAGALQRMNANTATAIPAFAPAQAPAIQSVSFTNSRAMDGDPQAGLSMNLAYVRGETPRARVEVHGLDGRTGVSLCVVHSQDPSTPLGASAAQNPTGGVGVFDIDLTGLAAPGPVGATLGSLNWMLFDANGVEQVGPPTLHSIYHLLGNPTTPLRYEAVTRAAIMAGGQGDVQSVATALRAGIRSSVDYDGSQFLVADPLSLLTTPGSSAVCSDFANLHILLAKTLGLPAHPVVFWGGFEHGGRNIWASSPVNNVNYTLTNVQATDLAYHSPAGAQQGWDFTYHAIADIGGTLHDAALNRVGYSAQAIHQGLQIDLPQYQQAIDITTTVNDLVMTPLVIGHVSETVDVRLRHYPNDNQFTDAHFGANALGVVPVPQGAQGQYQDPVTTPFPGLPPGLTVDPTGLLLGVPTAPGDYAFTITSSLGGFGTVSVRVN